MISAEMRDTLIAESRAVRQKAYAPYSNYLVGAALLGENGKIYTGCNVENASYGLTNCAERTAVFKMVADGCRRFLAISVATKQGGSPCGACRQVMVEFAGDIPVYIADEATAFQETSLHTLLPKHFGPEHLTKI